MSGSYNPEAERLKDLLAEVAGMLHALALIAKDEDRPAGARMLSDLARRCADASGVVLK